ncbi:hypothetical protein CWM62_14595, partial [Klebsiella sp. C-Nf10]
MFFYINSFINCSLILKGHLKMTCPFIKETISDQIIMKILVTGGAGFIGSAVVRHIIENTL